MNELKLGHGLVFEDLYEGEGLTRIDVLFCRHLGAIDTALNERLATARRDHALLDKKDESQLLLDIAPHLEDFIAGLFGVRGEIAALSARHDELAPLYACKRQFVQKRCKKIPASIADAVDSKTLVAELAALFGEPFTETAFARHVLGWLDHAGTHEVGLEKASHYAAWAMRHGGGILFRQPEKTDPYHLVPVETTEISGAAAMCLSDEHQRHREGFALTDAGTDLAGALDEANYCIWCHKQGRDSCSTGLRDRKTAAFKKSAFDIMLTGCPLEEKISEMNLLAADGNTLGALAVACVDNPLVAATGHRICNECMKACIYQKQEPVNIPQVETRMLKDVLQLPWGFEIYSLLTRWNPLNLKRPLPRVDSGYKVLVAGLGPSGFTLAHHLMNDGCTIAGMDGLKIEPLPAYISGVSPAGERVAFQPIHAISELYESLDERVMAGFGGVTEYGITVRWDKNFLKVIRLLLERRARFTMFGGVRFGGTLTVDDAYQMGFDHVALCMGAGAPTVISIPNGMARGVRQASDFLMALQLTGAARRDSVANLQVRLPVIVIGGGLTAIDTATESLAYYPVQVEKFLARFDALAAERGEQAVRAPWGDEETMIADEFLTHARAIRAERQVAAREEREPDILGLLNQWGGSTIAYRRRLIDSPSYTLNHEEVSKALEEGIRFAELLTPAAIDVDQYGHIEAIRLIRRTVEDGRIVDTDESLTLPARSVLVAAGTKPNVVLGLEDPGNLKLDGKYFRALDENGEAVKPEWVAKPGVAQVLTNIRLDGRSMSFFGDLHPSFAGNVVKAMASATQGYPVIGRMLEKCQPTNVSAEALISRLTDDLYATVHKVERLTSNIIEVVVHAPRAARGFHPGQFYRLQNYEANALRTDDTLLAMEGIALTGASVDLEKGLISLILLEMGGSSDLCAHLKPGEAVVLMGPTGEPTEIVGGENVLLIGGGLGHAVLFSIGSAFRNAGSRVLYFAGYKKLADRYKVAEIEAAADEIVWCCDESPGFEPGRHQDKAFVGNMLEAMIAYGKGEMGEAEMPLDEIDRIIVIGSAGLMSVIADARHGVLKEYLKPDHIGIGSINSPMQCMMKKICAQCLQPHKDAKTGREKGVVFSCFNQDQLLDEVYFKALMQRLQQQSVQEKLTKQWVDRCLVQLGMR
ncbi:MAG: hypothetical protein R8K46_00340 [Mariprofundaceae bacterium]